MLHQAYDQKHLNKFSERPFLNNASGYISI